MKQSLVIKGIYTFLILISINSAHALVLTFDDIGPTSEFLPIPAGYGGLDWNNMFYIEHNYANQYTDGTPSGYTNGLVSGSYVAYNQDGTQAVTTSSSLFDFNGAFLTAAWNDGLNINIKGYDGTALLYETTLVVDTNSSTWFQLDYFNIDKLEFTTFGGIHNPNYIGIGTQFAMDNFTINANAVPIPTAVWLFGSGLIGLIGVARRKERA